MKKFFEVNNLKKILIKYKNKKIGLAHGTFDFFHYGHLLHLRKAKEFCDVLFVSVTSDKFIHKAPGRPIYTLDQRMDLISSIKEVDHVILSNQKTSKEIINLIRPDFYFKGNDYKDEEKDYSNGIKIEKKELKKYGGKIIFTNETTFSSTNLINRFSSEIDKETKEYLSRLKKNIDFHDIKNLIQQSSSLKTLVIGEIIKDEYIFCSPLGKSPKEQLISMKENKKEIYAGGVAASVNHLSSFISDCSLLSICPKDKSSSFLNKNIDKRIKKIFFKQDNYKIINKTRFIDNSNTKLFQICNIKYNEIKKSTENKIINFLNKNLKNYDHVIVHDFGQGLITKKIVKILEKKSNYLSINIQTNSSNIGFNYLTKFSKTNYFSIDEPEARLALSDEHSDTKILFKKLQKKIKFKSGSITFGKNGAYTSCGKNIVFCPALNKNPIDTLGAGDAFFVISSIISKISNDPKKIGFLGNIAGSYAVNYLGHSKYLSKEIFLNYVKTYLNL